MLYSNSTPPRKSSVYLAQEALKKRPGEWEGECPTKTPMCRLCSESHGILRRVSCPCQERERDPPPASKMRTVIVAHSARCWKSNGQHAIKRTCHNLLRGSSRSEIQSRVLMSSREKRGSQFWKKYMHFRNFPTLQQTEFLQVHNAAQIPWERSISLDSQSGPA